MGRTSTLMAMVLAAAMAGCAAADTGSTGAGLTAVDVGSLTAEVHYLAPDISPTPLTLEEIGDPADGTAVGFGVHGDYLVAWAAPNGVPRVGDAASVLGAWEIHDVTPIADDVTANGDDANSVTPNDPESLISVAQIEPLLEPESPVSVDLELREILIDWWGDDLRAWLEFWSGHPGCL